MEKREKLRNIWPESVGRRKAISFTMCKISNSLDQSLELNGWNQVALTKVTQRGNWSTIIQLCQKLNKNIVNKDVREISIKRKNLSTKK